MQIVLNKCYGGFSLSPRAQKRVAELKGRECYFFDFARNENDEVNLEKYVGITLEEAQETFFACAFSVPDPNDRDEETLYRDYSIDNRDIPRNDPILIQVVEELGEKANGRCAELRIIEIPDDIEWEITEYDGIESVAEKHRTWG